MQNFAGVLNVLLELPLAQAIYQKKTSYQKANKDVSTASFLAVAARLDQLGDMPVRLY
jgi:hypothetical protein